MKKIREHMSLPDRAYLTKLRIFFFLGQKALKIFPTWILINYMSQNWHNIIDTTSSGHQYSEVNLTWRRCREGFKRDCRTGSMFLLEKTKRAWLPRNSKRKAKRGMIIVYKYMHCIISWEKEELFNLERHENWAI